MLKCDVLKCEVLKCEVLKLAPVPSGPAAMGERCAAASSTGRLSQPPPPVRRDPFTLARARARARSRREKRKKPAPCVRARSRREKRPLLKKKSKKRASEGRFGEKEEPRNKKEERARYSHAAAARGAASEPPLRPRDGAPRRLPVEARDRRHSEPLAAPRRLRTGQGWPGVGPWPQWCRSMRRRPILGAVVAAYTCQHGY